MLFRYAGQCTLVYVIFETLLIGIDGGSRYVIR